MKPNHPMIFLIDLVLIHVVAFGQTDSSPKRTISEIRAAALESVNGCPGLLAALGKRLPIEIERGEYEIPSICWSDAIKELKPVKVYGHRLNVAIVLRIQDGKEEGIYVFNPVSAWYPIGINTDRFEFIRNADEHNVIDFRRIVRKINKSN